jgi:hypothetical protein
VVDDTIATFANAALLTAPGLRVDLLCSSLTKTFSGKGNVMAGSVLLNTQHGARSAALQRIFDGLQARHDLPALGLADAVVLEENSRYSRLLLLLLLVLLLLLLLLLVLLLLCCCCCCLLLLLRAVVAACCL